MKRTDHRQNPINRTGLLRLKLFRSHAIFSLLTALLVALVAFIYMKNELIESKGRSLLHALECRAARIGNDLDRGRVTARAVADRVQRDIAAEHDAGPGTGRPPDGLLTGAIAAWPEIRSASLYDSEGSLLGHAGAPPSGAVPLDGAAVTVGSPIVTGDGSPAVRYTTPCGKSFLSLLLDAPRLADALDGERDLGDTGRAFIGFGRDDRIDLLASAARDGPPPSKRTIGSIPRDCEAARPFVLAADGLRHVIRTEDTAGTPVFAALQPIAGTGWTLVATIEAAELKAPLWKAAFLILGSAALLVALSIFFAMKRLGPIADLMVLWNRELEEQVVERTAALEESESMYRLLAERVADGELIIQDGRTVYANRSFRELVGFADDGIEGRSYEEWIEPGSVKDMEQRDKLRTLGIAPPPRYRLKLQNAHGEQVHVEVVEKEIDHQGRPASLLSLRDIGAIRRLRMYETFLPTCSVCRAIRDDTGESPGKGDWISLEEYVLRHTEAQMSHTYCPTCEREALAAQQV